MDISLDTILLTSIIASLLLLISRRAAFSVPEASKNQGKTLNRQATIQSSYQSHDVFRIVITGGPCAGKTTGIKRLASELSENLRVFLVPEAATLLVKGGAINNLDGQDMNFQVEFQASLMHLQMALEDAFTEIASSFKEKSLVICDRGLMDGSAYIASDLWQALLDERGWTVVHLRDRRYEGVVHMVTAADGAEEYYTLSNNEARYEGVAEAKIVDQKLQQAWVGHSHFSIIDNVQTVNFEDKICKLVSIVLKFVGAPISQINIKKCLIRSPEIIPNIKDFPVIRIYIEDTFLQSKSGEVAKIQKRGQSGSFIYTHSIWRKVDDDEYSVNKCQITAREYILLGGSRDVSRKTVKRLRQCFIIDSQYYMLNTYLNVKDGISVLRVEHHKNIEEIVVPEGIHIIRSVEKDPGYSTYIMSKINWYMASRDIVFDH